MGARYLYPRPSESVSVHETHLYGLVIEEPTTPAMPWTRWRRLGMERLRVAAAPGDGLGELLR